MAQAEREFFFKQFRPLEPDTGNAVVGTITLKISADMSQAYLFFLCEKIFLKGEFFYVRNLSRKRTQKITVDSQHYELCNC